MLKLRRRGWFVVAGVGILESGCGAATGVLDSTRSTHDAGVAAVEGGARAPGDASRPDARVPDAALPDSALDAGADGRVDAPLVDAGRSDAGDADAHDAGFGALVAGHDLGIFGVTESGRIIYGNATGSVWGVPFAGGEPVSIAPTALAGLSVETWVSHDVVFMASTKPDALYVWSERTQQTVRVAPSAGDRGGSPGGVASPGSRHIAAFWMDAFGTSAVLANVDGTGFVDLDAVADVTFDGDRAVVGDDNGGVTALDGSHDWAATPLAPGIRQPRPGVPLAADAVGANVLIDSLPGPDGGAGGLVLAPLNGGPRTSIDPTGGGPLYLSPDSTFALYTTLPYTNPTLSAVALPGGAPYAIPWLAPTDLTWPHWDIAAVDVRAPGGPVAAISAADGSLRLVGVGRAVMAPNLSFPGSPDVAFTSDGSYALIGSPRSTLASVALPNGTETAPLSTSSIGVTPLAATTVLFGDNYAAGSDAGPGATTDLRVADVARGTTSTLVVAGVSIAYGVSPDLTRVAYTRDTGAPSDGLYVAAIPVAP